MAQAVSNMQPLTADTDKGGEARALKHCPHVGNDSIVTPDDLSVFREFKDITCDVDNCDKTECWMCCKCYKILCGRYANKHMIHHYKEETNGEHCIAMSMNDSSFWCFKCLLVNIPLSQLDALPQDVLDEVIGAYLDDQSIEPIFRFYEKAHLAHFGQLPPTSSEWHGGRSNNNNDNNVSNDAIPEDATTDSKENENKDKKETISKEFDAGKDILANVPDFVTGGRGVVNILKDSELNKTGIFYHGDMTKHKCEDHDHVERPGRIAVSYDELKKYGLLKRCKEYQCKELDLKTIEFTHPKQHIERMLNGYDPAKKNSKPKNDKHGNYDGDTFFNKHTPKASLLAAGGFYDSLEKVCITEEIDNGFALVRPPGHHACLSRAMGFCLFNNVVVGINGLKENYKDNPKCPKRVLIVDWDVHHGNGTQDLTYHDADILYFSVHRYAKGFFGFYPGTGDIEDVGEDAKDKKKNDDTKFANKIMTLVKGKDKADKTTQGDDKESKKNENENESKEESFNPNSAYGKNMNVTMTEAMGDYEYLLAWRDVLMPVAKEFCPDLIVVSAGFDACTGDPLGGMRVTPPCYGELTRQLLGVQKKLVILLEGGYNLESMPKAICCCVQALLTTKSGQNGNVESKENDNDNDNESENKHNSDIIHASEVPLLEIESTSHWKKKMNAAFELSLATQRKKWTDNEILLMEKAFGYTNGCLQYINHWSNNKSKNIIDFHRQWMKHYHKQRNVMGAPKKELYYATQYPNARRIDFIIEEVLEKHHKYWPSLQQLYKKYSNTGDDEDVKQLTGDMKNLQVKTTKDLA